MYKWHNQMMEFKTGEELTWIDIFQKFCELIDQFRGLGVKNTGSRSWVLNKKAFFQLGVLYLCQEFTVFSFL